MRSPQANSRRILLDVIEGAQLLDAAKQRAKRQGGWPPRQVSFGRVISSACETLFQFLIGRATCQRLGINAGWPRCRLVYRALKRSELWRACEEASRTLSPEERAGFEIPTVCPEIKSRAQLFVELHKLRHDADYGSGMTFSADDAPSAIAKAVAAMAVPRGAGRSQQKLFPLSLNFRVRH
jgi:hypothetical protein